MTTPTIEPVEIALLNRNSSLPEPEHVLARFTEYYRGCLSRESDMAQLQEEGAEVLAAEEALDDVAGLEELVAAAEAQGFDEPPQLNDDDVWEQSHGADSDFLPPDALADEIPENEPLVDAQGDVDGNEALFDADGFGDVEVAPDNELLAEDPEAASDGGWGVDDELFGDMEPAGDGLGLGDDAAAPEASGDPEFAAIADAEPAEVTEFDDAADLAADASGDLFDHDASSELESASDSPEPELVDSAEPGDALGLDVGAIEEPVLAEDASEEMAPEADAAPDELTADASAPEDVDAEPAPSGEEVAAETMGEAESLAAADDQPVEAGEPAPEVDEPAQEADAEPPVEAATEEPPEEAAPAKKSKKSKKKKKKKK